MDVVVRTCERRKRFHMQAQSTDVSLRRVERPVGSDAVAGPEEPGLECPLQEHPLSRPTLEGRVEAEVFSKTLLDHLCESIAIVC